MSGLAQDATARTGFPIGTLLVNTLGCLTIGFLSELAESRGFLTTDARAFLIVGLLGGFTTFSAFANETVSALDAFLRDIDPAIHDGLATLEKAEVRFYRSWPEGTE